MEGKCVTNGLMLAEDDDTPLARLGGMEFPVCDRAEPTGIGRWGGISEDDCDLDGDGDGDGDR